MSEVAVSIEGLDEAIRKCAPELVAAPLKHFFQRACISIQTRAREACPVDTGNLRAHILYEIQTGSQIPHWAKVGSAVFYAPFVEYGTGLLSTGEGGTGGVHWPPAAALNVWARRHGFASGARVARAIGMHGGIRPQPYLVPAFDGAQSDIAKALEMLKTEIAEEWASK